MFSSFGYSSPLEFMFGVGRSRDVGDRLRSRGYSRILIVTDPGIVESGIVEAVEAPLRADGFEIEFFAEVKSNPTVENVDAGAEALVESGAEVVVGLGGGSPIDTAKIISAVAANACSAHDLMTGSRQIEIPGVPQIAIPTTAGSGAESAKVSVLVDHETGEIFIEGGAELDQKSIDELKKAKIKSIEIVNQNKDFHSMMLLNTMTKDPSNNTEEALSIVYQLLRSGEPPNLETAQKFIERIFPPYLYYWVNCVVTNVVSYFFVTTCPSTKVIPTINP